MVARKSLNRDDCPSARALDVIGDWWSLLIVRDAFDGLTRFGEFQKSLGIAKNILTQRLRALTKRGILDLVDSGDGSRHQEYRLTAMGRDLFPVMVALRQWGERYLYAEGEPRSRLVERETGEAVHLHVRTARGVSIGPDRTEIRKATETDTPEGFS